MSQLTLYTNKISPNGQRPEIALEEAQAKYKRFEVNIFNKPEWFHPKINPVGKIPVLAIGGPDVAADQPSPESTKLAESLVIVELVADLYPDSGLLPKDPVQRAQARFFIESFASKVAGAVAGIWYKNESPAAFFPVVDALQAYLASPVAGKWAIGDHFSIADISVGPHLARIEIILSGDFGTYPAGEGKKAYETLQNDAKYARYRQYVDDLQTRESFKKTFDREGFSSFMAGRYPRN